MEINCKAMTCAVQGINGATNLMNNTAQNIATQEGELATEMVNQIVADKTLSANATTVHTYDEMMQELVTLGKQRAR